MNKIQICLIGFMCGMLVSITYDIIKIEKQLKELKEIKVIVDNLESQIKLLTPPPEFFELPVVRRP